MIIHNTQQTTVIMYQAFFSIGYHLCDLILYIETGRAGAQNKQARFRCAFYAKF